MKSLFVVLSLLVVFSFSFPLEKRQNDPSCDGFRITSPTQPGLVWTDGQCYQVSFDPGASKVNAVTGIDLYDTSNNFVQNQWKGSLSPGALVTPFFNLNLGPAHQSGSYYFKLTVTSPSATCSFDTVAITGIYNPNSPPVICPN